MTLFVLELSMSFFRSYDLVIVTVTGDVTLTPSSKLQNKSKRKRK